MRITPEEVAVYLRLMAEIQCFLNRRLNLVPDVHAPADILRLPTDSRILLHNAMWEHPECLKDFVDSNPANLPADELAVAESWQCYVKGKFYLERMLKKGAIFISSNKPHKVFLVWGLIDELEDVVTPAPLPILLETVLLPFRGRIIYDGYIGQYSISYGAGYRQALRDLYMAAKQQGQIIVSMEKEGDVTLPAPAASKTRDWRPVLAEIAESAGKLRAQANHPLQSTAFALLKASANLARETAQDPENEEELDKAVSAAVAAARRLLRETGNEMPRRQRSSQALLRAFMSNASGL